MEIDEIAGDMKVGDLTPSIGEYLGSGGEAFQEQTAVGGPTTLTDDLRTLSEDSDLKGQRSQGDAFGFVQDIILFKRSNERVYGLRQKKPPIAKSGQTTPASENALWASGFRSTHKC
jgi:hypothetical protein